MTPTEAIIQAANEFGVDPALALATAQQESGLNPTAVGDNGCSFGLFQLNTCGGEGVGMSQAQLFDPLTNARRALSEFANVQRTQPSLSPGELAAAAQRPADPGAYATSVQAIYDKLVSAAGGLGSAVAGLTGGAKAVAGVAGGVITNKGGKGCSFLDIGCWLSDVEHWLQRGFFILVGVGVVVLGLVLLLHEDEERLRQSIQRNVGPIAEVAAAG